MNNKEIGNAFEKKLCEILSSRGFWVHFIVPDSRGAQPFDIIAVRKSRAYAIECKTLSEFKKCFSVTRLEDNQRLAFTRWLACGNGEPIIAVKQGKNIVTFEYIDLITLDGKIDMKEKIQNEISIKVDDYFIYGILAKRLEAENGQQY